MKKKRKLAGAHHPNPQPSCVWSRAQMDFQNTETAEWSPGAAGDLRSPHQGSGW